MSGFYPVQFPHFPHTQVATESYSIGPNYSMHTDSTASDEEIGMMIQGLTAMDINQRGYCTLVLSSNKLLQRRKTTNKPQAAYS